MYFKSSIILKTIVLALLFVAITAPARSDESGFRRDHNVALQALLNGEILPLEKILVEVRKGVPGEFIDVELGRYHKMWIYKLKILTPEGQLLKIIADAKTGVLVKIKQKPLKPYTEKRGRRKDRD